MELPKKIEVCGQSVKIVWEKLHDAHGEYRADDKCIVLNTHLKDNPEGLRGTFFHELVHCVMHLTGWNELLVDNHEEGLVRCLENNLLPAWDKVLKDL